MISVNTMSWAAGNVGAESISALVAESIFAHVLFLADMESDRADMESDRADMESAPTVFARVWVGRIWNPPTLNCHFTTCQSDHKTV